MSEYPFRLAVQAVIFAEMHVLVCKRNVYTQIFHQAWDLIRDLDGFLL